MEGQGSGERIIAHLGFARAVAARSLDPRCRGADREDLIAWGVVGLVQAAQRYRGDLGASFGAYAARRVRGQVLDALALGEDGFTIQLESVVKASAAGFTIVEVPIVLGTRKHGRSHMNYTARLFADYWRLLMSSRRWLRPPTS